MTVEALRLLVAAVERPPGPRVIEAVHVAAGPAHEREVAPSVIGVTAGAALVLDAGVKASSPVHEPGDLLVARNTARVHLLFPIPPPAVAGLAPQRPFEPLVRFGQRAGRDLGGDRSGEANESEREAAILHQSHVAPTATTTATWMRTAIRAAMATGLCSTCQ